MISSCKGRDFLTLSQVGLSKSEKEVQNSGSKTRIIHINPVIDLNFFQKLNSKESYEIVIDAQERYKFDITNGDHALTASMDSEFGKLIINDKEFPVWHGKIESNSLTFSVN